MSQENDKKWQKTIHIISNAIIWIAVLAAVAGCLFLSFRHDNTAAEVQSNSVEIVAQTADGASETVENDSQKVVGGVRRTLLRKTV